jgi:uncharacterized protein (TIGR00106 family)
MSVLLEFSMFPIGKDESVKEDVAKIIKMIDESGVAYQLTPMGTIIETEKIESALEIVQKSYAILEQNSNRVYAALKFDIRKGNMGRLKSKIASIEKIIGEVST